MTEPSLSIIYRGYINCLNRQDWAELEHFVHDKVRYNGQLIGLSGYREMLEQDFYKIPDLYFNVHLLVAHVGFRGVVLQGSGWRFRRASDVMKAAG